MGASRVLHQALLVYLLAAGLEGADGARIAVEREGPDATAAARDERVLLFWAAGSHKDTVDLVTANVQHAREQWPHVSVFLAHYDGDAGRRNWQELAGEDWYRRNVDASASRSGYKFQILQGLMQDGTLDIKDYNWVWVLDEDADFSATPLDELLQLADESGAVIATPAFTQPGGLTSGMSFPFQAPRADCRFRYAPIVEVSFPIFKPAALQLLLGPECEHCLHQNTAWGICRMWCSWTAKQLGQQPDRACAVLDKAPLVHMDFKTLPGKYTEAGFLQRPGSKAFREMAMRDFQDVRDHHGADFDDSPAELVQESECL